MSYIVLARKLRPKTLEEVIGQPLVVKALTNALQQGTLHPAYLLTGTHGTGKTSIGRIIAKALNCENGPLPCLTCHHCQMMQSGTHPDLYEIDAASRTKVEDTRDILEHIQYMPTVGKKKIYLIDEVHMLSQHSFNALLKTLEEPPEHVQFILATTEPHKVPKTILSRCLHFNLQPLSSEKIIDYIIAILKKETIDFDAIAIEHIAQAAKGSMRDALSLLDQLLAISPKSITTAVTSSLLSTLPNESLDQLLIAIAKKDIEAIKQQLAQHEKNNIDFKSLLNQLAEKIIHTSICQLQGKETPLTGLWPDTYLQVLYHMLIKGIQDLNYGPSPYLGALMCLVRMAVFYPKEVINEPVASTETHEAPKSFSLSTIIPQLSISPMVKELLSHCSLVQKNDHWSLTLQPSHKHLLNAQVSEKVSVALKALFKKDIKVTIAVGMPNAETPYQEKQQQITSQTQTATQHLNKDPVLKSLLQELNITQDNITIEPAKTE